MRSAYGSDDLFDLTRNDEAPTSVRGGTTQAVQTFDAEEMQAIREQYEERAREAEYKLEAADERAREAEQKLEAAEARADELEFQLKRVLAAVRDGEEQMRKMRISLESLAPAEERERRHTPAPMRQPVKAPVIGGPVQTSKPARPATLPGHPVSGSPPPAKLGPPPLPAPDKPRGGPLPPRDINGYHKRMVA